MTSFRRHGHPLEGSKCPHCGEVIEFCEIECCNSPAIYEGWVHVGIMLQRRHLCREHAKLTEGFKAKGEKVFEEAN